MAKFNDNIFNDLKTKNGKTNYIGCVKKYFDILNSDPHCNEDTRLKYIYTYENIIFPLINENIAVEDMNVDFMKGVINRIIEVYNPKPNSISGTYKPLLYRPVRAFFKDPSNNLRDPFVGASYEFENRYKDDDIEKQYFKIPKSLKPSQQKQICEYLLSDPETEDGALLGLAIMFFLGTRINEAAAVRFRHINKYIEDITYTMLTIIETVEYKKNTTKIGGKTPNAFRRLLLIKRFSDFLEKRKEYLEKVVTFPIKKENGEVIESVEDLNVACVGKSYDKTCRADYISTRGKELLINMLGFSEINISGISSMIENKIEYLDYKEPTTYLFRRAFLTDLYLIGFTEEEIEYWSGHDLEDSILSRGMFGSKHNLIKINNAIQRLPMNTIDKGERIIPNNQTSHYEDINNVLIQNSIDYKIIVKEKQLNDPIVIKVKDDESLIINSYPDDQKQEMIINLTDSFIDEYKK